MQVLKIRACFTHKHANLIELKLIIYWTDQLEELK